MNAELVRKNSEFLKRFRRVPRMGMPDYIAHQKNEGKPLEPRIHQPKGHGRGPSERAKIASRVLFSRDLKSVSTDRQLKVYALKVADQIISNRRKRA